jgi:tryptophan synthase alpha chain
MKRLTKTFERLRENKEAAFMPFLVIGDPDFETSMALSKAVIDAGADILEFGFAFSDPPADGPVIQLADQRALRSGFTTKRAFDFMGELRQDTEVPFALLIYYNLILQQGVDEFYRRAAEVGVDAVLVADLPIEEAEEMLAAATKHDVAPIFIVTELSSAERIKKLAEAARGYFYVVTNLGVTGTRESVTDSLEKTIAAVRPHTDLPLLAGFGISRPEHVENVLRAGADGAIVGSALIKRVEANLNDHGTMLQELAGLTRALKEATKSGQ